MPVYQSFNPKTKRWVKYTKDDKGVRITNVKTSNPSVPFKGVTKKRKK